MLTSRGGTEEPCGVQVYSFFCVVLSFHFLLKCLQVLLKTSVRGSKYEFSLSNKTDDEIKIGKAGMSNFY